MVGSSRTFSFTFLRKTGFRVHLSLLIPPLDVQICGNQRLKTPCGLLVNFFASYSPSHDHIVVEILIVFHGPLVFVSFLHSLCFCDFLKCGVDSVKPSLLLSLTTGCLKHTHSVSARP